MLRTNNTILKFGFLGVFLVLLTSFSSPHKTGKKIYKLIKKNKIEKLESYYISKEELRVLINEMEPKPSENQINNVLESYDSGRESYLMLFKEIANEYHWGQSRLDSINYDYVIAKEGEDDKILWPESKDFNSEETDKLKTKITMYLSDSNDRYILKFEMLYFNGDWKMFNMMKNPYFMKLENN